VKEAAIQAVAELARSGMYKDPIIKEVLGRQVLFLPNGEGTYDRTDLGGPGPQPPVLMLHTLTGLVGYLNDRNAEADVPAPKPSAAVTRDGAILEDVLVHVANHLQVNVLGALDEEAGAYRTVYATAAFFPLIGSNGIEFTFGKYLDLETFNIALQTLFEDTPDRSRISLVTGTVRDESVKTSKDDGVSQIVVAHAGVVGLYETGVPNPVRLRPFRTFREVEQPESLFVLRLKQGPAGSLPTAALFEADGGAWKLEAIERIASYLRARVPAG
jgi:hypothetical protein